MNDSLFRCLSIVSLILVLSACGSADEELADELANNPADEVIDVVDEKETTTEEETDVVDEEETTTEEETDVVDEEEEQADIPLQLTLTSASTLQESATSASLTFSLDQAFTEQVTLALSSNDITTDSSIDYNLPSEYVIEAGQTNLTINLTIFSDSVPECDEKFEIVITKDSTVLTFPITIQANNKGTPSITFSKNFYQAPENAGEFPLDIELSESSCSDLTLKAIIIDTNEQNTATLGSDFSLPEIVIQAGATTASIQVNILDDLIKEDGEFVWLTLEETSDNANIDTQTKLGIVPVITQLNGGHTNTCAITEDGLVKCWGYNEDYTLAVGHGDSIAESYGSNIERLLICHSKNYQSIINTQTHPSTSDSLDTCNEHGGISLSYGLDLDSSSTLDESEISTVKHMCSGDRETLVFAAEQSAEAVGPACEYGGSAVFWGSPPVRENTIEPVNVLEQFVASDLGTDLLELNTGDAFSCSLDSYHKVKCWGSTSDGILGIESVSEEYLGDDPDELGDNLQAIDFGQDITGKTFDVTQLSKGNDHACVLLDNGGVKCWGNGSKGKLGYGNTENKGDDSNEMGNSLPFVDLGSDAQNTPYSALQISLGSQHSCAILDNHKVKCWGNESNGNLGYDNIEDKGDDPGEMGNALPFVDLGTDYQASKIIAGNDVNCVVFDDGSVKCWGANRQGEIGIGSRQPYYGNGGIISKVEECHTDTQKYLTSATRFNDDNSCNNDSGYTFKFGYDVNQDDVLDDSDQTYVNIRCDYDDNEAYGETYELPIGSSECPTYGGAGHLKGFLTNNQTTFGQTMGDFLPNLTDGTNAVIHDITIGYNSLCALIDDGDVKCWGGYYGRGSDTTEDYGDDLGETLDKLAPVNLGTNKKALAITGKGYSVCALLNDNSVICWGENEYGALGHPDLEDEIIGDGLPSSEMGDMLKPIRLFQ